MMMDPNPFEERLLQLKFFPDGEQVLCNNQTAGSDNVRMETLLKKARSVIIHEGVVKFLELVQVISEKEPYDELGCHMIRK